MQTPPAAEAPAPDAAQAAALLRLENQFCFMLYSTSHALTRAYAPLLEELGLTYPQYLVMLLLWEQDGVSVKQLGQKLFLDSGTLTPLLKRLEAAGLIRRARNKSDERQVDIFLQEAGSALRSKALRVPQQVLCMSGKSLPELEQLREDLRSLRAQLLQTAG